MKRIFLTGYMGSGKTAIGRELAKQLHLSYIDTDFYIENRYHKKITEIFAAIGENGFRDIEHRILLEIADLENVVVSTGGGLPCFNDNMTLMNKRGLTIFLDIPVNVIVARLETSKTERPVLKNRSGHELFEFVKVTLEQRRPYYEQSVIHYFNDTNADNDIRNIAENLIKTIKYDSINNFTND